MKGLVKEHAYTFLTGLGALVAVWLLGCGTMVAQSSLNHSVLEDALKRTEIELTKKAGSRRNLELPEENQENSQSQRGERVDDRF